VHRRLPAGRDCGARFLLSYPNGSADRRGGHAGWKGALEGNCVNPTVDAMEKASLRPC